MVDPTAQARVEQDLLAEIERAKREYHHELTDLCDHAQAIMDALDTVRGINDHVEEGFGYLLESAGASALAVTLLATGWIRHPGQWREQVKGVAVGAGEFIAHPIRTSIEAGGEQAYRDGDYGVGVAQSATMGAAGLGLLRHVLRRGVLDAGDRNRSSGGPRVSPAAAGSPIAPLLLRQTTDELFDGVDLRRQEGQGDAHTLAQHVGWTADDLAARSERMANGRRDGLPAPASGFPDLPTAERAVNLALSSHRADVDAWLASSHGRPLAIVEVVGEEIGTTAWRVGAEDITVQQTVVTVVLRRDPAGNAYVLTAYPGERASAR